MDTLIGYYTLTSNYPIDNHYVDCACAILFVGMGFRLFGNNDNMDTCLELSRDIAPLAERVLNEKYWGFMTVAITILAEGYTRMMMYEEAVELLTLSIGSGTKLDCWEEKTRRAFIQGFMMRQWEAATSRIEDAISKCPAAKKETRLNELMAVGNKLVNSYPENKSEWRELRVIIKNARTPAVDRSSLPGPNRAVTRRARQWRQDEMLNSVYHWP
jgi:hypothetical protein